MLERGTLLGGIALALLVGVVGVSVAEAFSCPEFTAKKIASFTKSATAQATRCPKRNAHKGLPCPDARLTENLAKLRVRTMRPIDKRCPGSTSDAALVAIQEDILCQVLAACPTLPPGAVVQRLVASELVESPPPRDLTIDMGWQGFSHGMRLFEGAEFTATRSNCDGTTDTLCDFSGATNGIPFGPPSPILAGGVGFCMVFEFASDVTGTIDTATGDMAEHAVLHGKFYAASSDDDHPCPTCDTMDGDPQVGESGTCSSGANMGMPCTVEGLTRPVFAGVSSDCPPLSASQVADFTTPVTASTGTTSFATTVDSPKCTSAGFGTKKCLCDTCNDASNTQCSSNADCPMSGGAPGICGGKRCIGGTNVGSPCTTNSSCPGGVCNRPGQPTQPNPCFDVSEDLSGGVCTPDSEGTGTCLDGPTYTTCALETNHFCTANADCTRTDDYCTSRLASCFPDPIAATGTPDVPMDGEAHPTLVGTFCMGPTAQASTNYAVGLPGPVRFTWPAQLLLGE
jgi:hypothetical protein